MTAERRAIAALDAAGWQILGRRLRTEGGEIDIVAARDGLVAFIEVKARSSFAVAATALSARQQRRLANAASILVARHPEWGAGAVRFDVILVDGAGRVRRIADAFRPD